MKSNAQAVTTSAGSFTSSARRGTELARRRLSVRTLLTASCFLASIGAGCASGGSEASPQVEPRSNNRIITREELVASGVADAFQVIQRLRPLWLTSGVRLSLNNATEIVVLQDDTFFGGVEVLSQIPLNPIREIRYMTGSEATNRYPFLSTGRAVAGAIIVYLGPPDR